MQVDWSRVNRMGRWYKPWFYHHVKTFLQTGDQVFICHKHQLHHLFLNMTGIRWAHIDQVNIIRFCLFKVSHPLCQSMLICPHWDRY